MSEIVAEGIIEADRLRTFAGTFTSKPTGIQAPFVSEVKVHFDGEGLHVSVCDSANVAMMAPTHLSKKAFESYDAPGRVTIGINLVHLTDFIKPADGGDLVNFAVDMETRRLRIEYGSAKLDLGLIDPESIRAEPEQPDLDLPNSATITGEQLDEALEVADLVSDHVRIAVDADADALIFDTQGDTSSAGVEYPGRECIDYSFSQASESLFSLDYLRMLAKPIPDTAEVRMDVGEEYPVQFEWETIDGHFQVSQTLAPRIQTD